MNTRHLIGVSALYFLVFGLAGCATAPYDYSALKASRPKSILVLPPVNDSNVVDASNSVFSTVTLPLAESGYYVYPVTLVAETFRQNGLNNPAEIAMVSPTKLREIFGADTALYIQIKQYGTTYYVISSASVVTADARLVDLRTGIQLWSGTATASSAENQNAAGGGLVGLLVQAVVNQIIESTTDASHKIAGITSARLLTAGAPKGLLYGPRSPKYDPQ